MPINIQGNEYPPLGTDSIFTQLQFKGRNCRPPPEMAPGQKMYPRATVKKIVKAHSKCNVSKNVDVMVSPTSTVIAY